MEIGHALLPFDGYDYTAIIQSRSELPDHLGEDAVITGQHWDKCCLTTLRPIVGASAYLRAIARLSLGVSPQLHPSAPTGLNDLNSQL